MPINQSISQSINRSINQSIYQSINRSINESMNQSVNQSISQSINQPINRSNNQSINQSINRTINQSINQAVSLKRKDQSLTFGWSWLPHSPTAYTHQAGLLPPHPPPFSPPHSRPRSNPPPLRHPPPGTIFSAPWRAPLCWSLPVAASPRRPLSSPTSVFAAIFQSPSYDAAPAPPILSTRPPCRSCQSLTRWRGHCRWSRWLEWWLWVGRWVGRWQPVWPRRPVIWSVFSRDGRTASVIWNGVGFDLNRNLCNVRDSETYFVFDASRRIAHPDPPEAGPPAWCP